MAFKAANEIKRPSLAPLTRSLLLRPAYCHLWRLKSFSGEAPEVGATSQLGFIPPSLPLSHSPASSLPFPAWIPPTIGT